MSGVTIKTILVPTDFSDGSLRAMRYAMDLSEVFGAQVIVLHVVEPPAYGVELTGAYPGVQPEMTKKVAEIMHDWVDEVRGQGVRVEWHVEIGSAFGEIRAAVDRYRADLIVMGTHGRTGLPHMLLGSVAERVVQHAPCPVLTVKATGHEGTGGAAATREAPIAREPDRCLICAKPSPDSICEACKTRVQAEASARKRAAERGSGGRAGG